MPNFRERKKSITFPGLFFQEKHSFVLTLNGALFGRNASLNRFPGHPVSDFRNREVYNIHGVVSPRETVYVHLISCYDALFGRNAQA